MNDPDIMSHTRIHIQARLLRRAKKRIYAWRTIVLTRFHYRHVLHFLKTYRAFVYGLCALLITQLLVETALIIIGRHYSYFDTSSVVYSYVGWIIAVLSSVFLLVSFFALKYERTLIVYFANHIRKRLFASYIYGHASSSRARARLIAQISYHVPLVSLGVSHVFFGVLRIVLYGGVVGILAYVGNFSVWIYSGVYVLVCGVVFLFAYFFSRYWTSQEVTYYSRIMQGIEIDASDTDFITMFGQKERILTMFDRLVEFDSFFRIRRDVFMGIGYAVVFVLVLICSIVVHAHPQILNSVITSPYSAERIVVIFLFVYISRALVQAYRAGLYIFPARLGLFLTLRSTRTSPVHKKDISLSGKSIRFHARKTKLFFESPYYRRMDFLFHPGDRILIQGDNLSGKTSFARMCAGISAYTPRAFTITVGEERLDFFQWRARVAREVYVYDPSIRTERSLIEYIVGKVKEDISAEEFASVIAHIHNYPSIVALVAPDGNYNVSARHVLSNPIQACALHILHCIVSKPSFIIIDNFWIDLNYPRIRDMMQILDTAVPSSIILVCSRVSNEYFSYTQHYVFANTITRLL